MSKKDVKEMEVYYDDCGCCMFVNDNCTNLKKSGHISPCKKEEREDGKRVIFIKK